jgi:hypothetical protein
MSQIYPAAYTLLMMAALWAAGTFFVISLYRKYKHSQYIVLLIATISMTFWAFLMSLSFIYGLISLLRISTFFYAIALSQGVLFFDLIWKERPNVFRMSVVTGLIMLELVLMWDSDAVILKDMGGYIIPYWNGTFLIVTLLTLLVSLLFCFHTAVILWLKMPKNMKRELRGLIPGIIILAPGSLIGRQFFGMMGLSIMAVLGIAILGYYGIKNPQLLYILPFTLHRLIVINKKSGLTLYDYQWTESQINDVLIGGLVKALQNISYEILNQGHIQELVLDNGILLLNEGHHVMVGIFASKASNYLKSCIKKFTENFETLFNIVLCNEEDCEITQFTTAEAIISSYFAHIPKRI